MAEIRDNIGGRKPGASAALSAGAVVGAGLVLGGLALLAARKFAGALLPPGGNAQGPAWGLPSDDHIDIADGTRRDGETKS